MSRRATRTPMPSDAPTHAPGSFPTTRLSLVAAAGRGDPGQRRAALELLAAAYWKPVYRYLRLRRGHPAPEAEDLTQEVLLRLVSSQDLSAYDPARARFRTWLRVVADGVSGHAREAGRRVKRGGRAVVLPLEFEDAEGEVRRLETAAPRGGDPDELFEREFVRELFGSSVEALRSRCETGGRQAAFAVFQAYDLAEGERPTYAALAQRQGLTESQVTTQLAWARGQFRRLALERLRELSSSESDFRQDARRLFGGEDGTPR